MNSIVKYNLTILSRANLSQNVYNNNAVNSLKIFNTELYNIFLIETLNTNII